MPVQLKPPNRQARNVFNRHVLDIGARYTNAKPAVVEEENCKARTDLEAKLVKLEAAEEPDKDFIELIKGKIEKLPKRKRTQKKNKRQKSSRSK